MSWQILLGLSIISGYFIQPFLNKRVADLPSLSISLLWQYLFSAVFASALALIFYHNFLNDKRFFAVIVIGIMNALGCYCYWRAIAISLSKTSVFTWADDLIGMSLGYIILKEANFLNVWLEIGIIICLTAVFVFLYDKWHNRKDNSRRGSIGIWIAIYSIVWGVAIFSMRYLAIDGMSPLSFTPAWYLGSLIGALTVFIITSGYKEKALRFHQIKKIIPLSAIIMISLMLAYGVRMLAPLIITQPVYQISEMIFPTIIGLWIFKEIKELNFISKVAIAAGLIGGLIILFSYR